MAEDRKAELRRKAARSALQGNPQSESVRNRIQDVLVLSGGVLTSGASYEHLMRTIREYADETHQPLERVLRDSIQLEGIIAGEGITESHRQFQDTFREQGRKRALANVIMEHGGDLGDGKLTPQELKNIREVVLTGDIYLDLNELPQPVRIEVQTLDKRLKSAQLRARRGIQPVVLHSPGGESPRLAQFVEDYRLSTPGGRREGSRQIMKNWKKNVDPEFLKKLSFVHWTSQPYNLAVGKGIPVTNESLSAAIYFRGDPTGHGFVSNRIYSAPYGLVLEGDITWTGNRDVYSAGGEVGGSSMTYVRDPILDEATFETQATRMERRMMDAVEAKRPTPRPGLEDYPFDFNPNINEALIKKPRVVGIVVDPSRYDLSLLRNHSSGADLSLHQAMIFAEEMGVPIYDIAGQPFPEIFQPESVNPAEIKRVAQNFPSAAEITGGKGFARTAGGQSLFQALADLEGRALQGGAIPMPQTPSVQELREARRLLEDPTQGGKVRARLRNAVRERLWQERQLLSGEETRVSYKTTHGHRVDIHEPLSTPEEFAEAWRFERARPFPSGHSPDRNVLFDDLGAHEELLRASPEEIYSTLVGDVSKKRISSEIQALLEQVGEDGAKTLADWKKWKAVQGEEPTASEIKSLLEEIYDNLAEEAREQGKEAAYRQMVGEDEATTLGQEEVQGKEEAVKRKAERKASRSSLDDLLREEGIPKESFIDFSELPENQGKPTRIVIEAYKIAGELPESAGVPEGRSPKAYPLQGLSPEPRLQPGTVTDAFGETVRQPTSIVSDPTPEQKAFIAQDPEARLSVVEGSSPEYKPQLSVEKARAALADPAQQDDFIHWLATQDPEARIPDKYADLTPTSVEAEWRGGFPEIEEEAAKVLEDIASGKVETTPEAKKALLADKAIKAKWGPRIMKGLTVLGDVALAADLGYQLGKHGPSGIMDVGAHTVEGAALLAELPKMAADQFVPGYGETGVHLGTEMLAGAGRAVKGTMAPFHRHRDRQERVKKLEGLQAEYESTGLDTMAARRQAAADIAAGGVAPAQPGVKFQSPEEVREEWIQEQKRAKQPPMTTDPREMARWAAKRALEK